MNIVKECKDTAANQIMQTTNYSVYSATKF